MKQLKTYILTRTPDEQVHITLWALTDDPTTAKLLYNGGEHALLYRSEKTDPIIIDYIPRRFQPFLADATRIVVTELDPNTQEITRRYHVPVTHVTFLPPAHLEVSKQDLVTWALQGTTLQQQKAYFAYPLKDGGLLFMIQEQLESPETPTLFFDGKNHALLRHSAKKTLVLDYLEPTLVPLLSRLEQVWICECDFTNKKLIREYKAPLKRSNRLPEIKLEISAEDLASALITPTHQQKIYYFIKTEQELHLFLLRHKSPPQNACILYDGGAHALLYRNEKEGVILGYLPKAVGALLKTFKTVTVHGCDFDTGSETFVYPASVRLVSKLPPVTWDINLPFL